MEEVKAKVGRPSLFTEDMKDLIFRCYEKGLTDSQVADIASINVSTLNSWKQSDPKFLESINELKDKADELVEKSLRARAIGYSHKAVKFIPTKDGVFREEYIEHYPPDPTSMIFWLKNRKPKEWREKQEIEQTNKNIQIVIEDDEKDA